MADALSRYRQAEPSKDALKRYRQEPSGDTLGALAKYLGLQGYWDRQGQIAQDGLNMAEQGAQTVRGGDPRGFAGMFMGPAGYLASPITALLPTEAETYAARDLPEWFKPGAAAGIGTMMAVMPGPKGLKGLGKAEEVAADAAEVEKLRARMRMFEDAAPVKQATPERIAQLKAEAEAQRALEGPAKKYEVPPMEDFLPRDQALRNLTEAPDNAGMKPITVYHGSSVRGLKPHQISTRNAIETRNTVFAASNEDVASTFTVPREYGEPMYYDEMGREVKPGKVHSLNLLPKNPYEVPAADAQRFIDDTTFQGQVIEEARRKGHDLVIAKNVKEGIGETYPGDVFAILDDGVIQRGKK